MIAVTGASGYIGGAIVSYLRREGHEVLVLSRGGGDREGSARYELGSELERSCLSEVSAVVHAAWDFAPKTTSVFARNVEGSMPLLEAAAANGARVILISSLSAFSGCRSEYGLAKFELEGRVAAQGGVSIRPGIVYGPALGGIFGTIAKAVGGHRFVPLLTGRRLQRLFLSDDESLCALVAHLCDLPTAGLPRGTVLAAYPVPISLRQLVLDLAATLGGRATPLPVPWQVVYLVLRLLETLGVAAPFRADSVLALANPIPLPQVAQLVPSPIAFAGPALNAAFTGRAGGGAMATGGK